MGGSSTQYNFDQPGSASNLLSAILRNQYSNYKAMFVPEEAKLIDYATDPNTIPNAQKRAIADVQQGFRAENAGFQKNLNGTGIQLTKPQRDRLGITRGNTQALATVDAANRAGTQAYDTISNTLAGIPGQQALPGVQAPNISGTSGLGSGG
jgi:hypothetical protein